MRSSRIAGNEWPTEPEKTSADNAPGAPPDRSRFLRRSLCDWPHLTLRGQGRTMCVAVHTINLMHSRSSSYVRCVLSCGIAQDQLRASLNERGIEVVGATSGVDALVRVSGRSGDFSAVVVAHEFWGTNEISLVKRLRALNGQGRDLITGKDLGLAEAPAYYELPTSSIFRKPLDSDVLTAIVLHDNNGRNSSFSPPVSVDVTRSF
jgi:hypothetical protein